MAATEAFIIELIFEMDLLRERGEWGGKRLTKELVCIHASAMGPDNRAVGLGGGEGLGAQRGRLGHFQQ